MNVMTEDNTVYVLNKTIKRFGFKVPYKAIADFLLSHPHYPTLKSVCDALNKWKIEHYPLKLEPDEIKALELPFIAHLNESGGQLAFVEKIKDGKVEYRTQKGKKLKKNFDEFAKGISGAVVLIEPNQKISHPEYLKNEQEGILSKMFLPLGILAVLLISCYNFISSNSENFRTGLLFWALLSIAVLGAVASVFLILHEFKIHTAVGDKLCGFSSKTDCSSVLSSNASKVFGNINWADAGLVYFTGAFIFSTGAASLPSLTLLAITSALVLPYTIFSVYYQGFKLKMWCPFCLVVQLLLVAGFVVLLPVFKVIAFSATDLLRFTVSFLVPALVWILYKTLLEKTSWGNQQQQSLLALKRSPKLFRHLLVENGQINLDVNKGSLLLGNPNAPVTLTAFLSLYCSPCSNAFLKMKALLESCPEIRLNAIFSVYNDDETQQVINTIYYLHSTQGQVAALDFLAQWYSKSPQLRKELYGGVKVPKEYGVAMQVAEMNKELFDRHGIQGTPTVFVNGFKLPGQYGYDELEYFVNDIIITTPESKRQEAGTVHS
jgi:uncharacterized membrane protein